MIAYQKERIENAICYFAQEHFRRTHHWPSQTFMYKYLAYFDLQMLKETGRLPLDLTYRAMPYGPVPLEVYDDDLRIESTLYRKEKRGVKTVIFRATGKPDMDYFSETEKEKMDNLLYIFAQPGYNSETISEASHQQLRAWRVTWDSKPNAIIDKAETFENLEKKRADELTPSEERFLISQAIQKAGK